MSQLVDNRILVFDAPPDKLENDADAIAVLGQPDFETFDPRVSREQFAFPKDPTVDAEKQVRYVSEGFPGGNRVMAFDIRPESLHSGMPAMDVIGHLDDEDRDAFGRRTANDRIDARTTTLARAVALDPGDHRLWVVDEYNNRVLGFQLDRDNRLLEREARWVIGQANFGTARAERSATGINVPLAVAYDVAVDRGRGIASNMLPAGIAIDAARRRAFISDGGNNRVLVFDIHIDRLENGADAIAVIGQSDFNSREPGLSASSFDGPGHLAFDPGSDRLFVVDNRNHRVLAFDVSPETVASDVEAELVIGQPDFFYQGPKTDRRGSGVSERGRIRSHSEPPLRRRPRKRSGCRLRRRSCFPMSTGKVNRRSGS